LVTLGDERTSPITAQALPVWVFRGCGFKREEGEVAGAADSSDLPAIDQRGSLTRVGLRDVAWTMAQPEGTMASRKNRGSAPVPPGNQSQAGPQPSKTKAKPAPKAAGEASSQEQDAKQQIGNVGGEE